MLSGVGQLDYFDPDEHTIIVTNGLDNADLLDSIALSRHMILAWSEEEKIDFLPYPNVVFWADDEEDLYKMWSSVHTYPFTSYVIDSTRGIEKYLLGRLEIDHVTKFKRSSVDSNIIMGKINDKSSKGDSSTHN